MHFENFDVLVDAKNYKDNVNKKQRDKINSEWLNLRKQNTGPGFVHRYLSSTNIQSRNITEYLLE